MCVYELIVVGELFFLVNPHVRGVQAIVPLDLLLVSLRPVQSPRLGVELRYCLALCTEVCRRELIGGQLDKFT
jgi:hypothetical protein